MVVADAFAFAELPSAAELVERIARHESDMLLAAGWRQATSAVAATEGRADAAALAAVVQAEIALLNLVMPRYVVAGGDTPVVQL